MCVVLHQFYLTVTTIAVYILIFGLPAFYLFRRTSRSNMYVIVLTFFLIYNGFVPLLTGLTQIDTLNGSILRYTASLFTVLFFAIYFYKTYRLTPLKFFAGYGLIFFLFVPYLFLFVIPCYFLHDLQECRKMATLLPMAYTTLFFGFAFQVLRKRDDNNKISGKLNFATLSALLCWATLPVTMYFDLQQIEQLATNSIFVLVLIDAYTRFQLRTKRYLMSLKNNMRMLAEFSQGARNQLQLIQQNVDNLHVRLIEEGQPELNVIKENLQPLAYAIAQLYPASGIMVPELMLINMSALIEEKIQFFTAAAQRRQVTVAEHIAQGIFQSTDRLHYERIFTTLLENAINNAAPLSRIEVTLKTEGGHTYFSVIDNGIKIAVPLSSSVITKSSVLILPSSLDTEKPLCGEGQEEQSDVFIDTINTEREALRETYEAMRHFDVPVQPQTSTPALTNPFEINSWRCGLTPREMEIVQLLADGLSHKRIGELLFISKKTVDTHVGNIFSKVRDTFEGTAIHGRVELLNVLEVRNSNGERKTKP